MTIRLVLLSLIGIATTSAFVQQQFAVTRSRIPCLDSKKGGAGEGEQQHVLSAGTFVEFEEKNRIHVGKIDAVEHKSNGGARYQVTDSEGRHFGISDRSVHFSMPAPNTPAQATKLFNEFCQAQDAPIVTLQEKLDITPELLEMAWEETAHGDPEEDHLLTAELFVELIHSRAASAMEKYLAWKLLKTEMAHIFFKEIKDHGRVVAFKAKTRKAVDAAKQTFCQSHQDSELCYL